MQIHNLIVVLGVVVVTHSTVPAAHAGMIRAAWFFDDSTLNGVGPDSTSGSIVDNTGVAPTFVSGVFGGQGLQFTGGFHDQVVFSGTKTSLELGTSAFSIVGWIKSDFTENVRFMYTQADTGFEDGFMLFHNGAESSLRLNQRDDDTDTFIQQDSTDDPTDSMFHMWGIVRESDGIVKMYFDGILKNTFLGTGSAVNLKNFNDLTLGGWFAATDDEMILDDIGIFDGNLSDTEMRNIADNGLSSFINTVPEPSSLILWASAYLGLLGYNWRRQR